MEQVFVLPQDIRHGGHLHCCSGVRRFCDRTGIDFDRLMRGEVTADELKATGQYMGIETAKNAEERAGMASRMDVPPPAMEWGDGEQQKKE